MISFIYKYKDKNRRLNVQRCKKYLNTYKYGGSDGEIISSEPTTDDYLSTYEILTYFRSLRRLVRTYFDHRINNPDQLRHFNNILDKRNFGLVVFPT